MRVHKVLCRISDVGAVAVLVMLFVASAALPSAAWARRQSNIDSTETLLGLPRFQHAEKFIYAPKSRTVRPMSVAADTAVNYDFVTAGSMQVAVMRASESPVNRGPSVSEVAHDFIGGPHSVRARIGGAAVEEAGPKIPGAFFSLRLHAGLRGPVRIRVEEAASTNSDYWILVDGIYVYHRVPQKLQQGLASESGPQFKGIVHYSFAVPKWILAKAPTTKIGRVIRVTFQNSASEPGDGARITRLWVIGTRPRNHWSGSQPSLTARFGGTVVDPSGARTRRGMTLTSGTYGRPYAILDFDRDVGGNVVFHVSGVTQPVVVGLAFSESYEYMTSVSDSACGTTGVCTETHYLMVKPGQTTVYDPNLRGGFRYLMVFLDTSGSIKISRLHVHFTPDPGVSDPAAYSGAFLSSSRLLDSIWYAGAYTVEMATIDPRTGRPYPATPGPLRFNAHIATGPTVIVDAAKRDRLDWIGNQPLSDTAALLSNPGNLANGSGEALAAEDSFAFQAAHQFRDGEIPGVYLPSPKVFPDPSGFLIAYGSDGIRGILDWWKIYLYTGDRAFLNKWWPAVQRDLAWAHSLLQPDGLISIPAAEGGTWGYDYGGESAYFNANYVLALRAAAQAALVEKNATLARRYINIARSVSTAFNARLWNKVVGAYQVSPSDWAIPQDGNALALFAGIADKRRAEKVSKYLNVEMGTRFGTETINQPHNIVQQYVDPGETFYEIAGELDQNTPETTHEAMTLFRRLYGYMLRSPLGTGSTLWEGVSLNGNPLFGSYTSLAHCFSCGTVGILTNYVLGVRPVSGGLSRFRVLPHPPSSLRWAEGTVPAGNGAVRAAWRQDTGASEFELEVVAPFKDVYTAGVPTMVAGEAVWANGHLIWMGNRPVSRSTPTGATVAKHDRYIELTGLRGKTILTEERCVQHHCPRHMPHDFGPRPSVPKPIPPARPGNPQTTAPVAALSLISPKRVNISPRSRSLRPVAIYKVLDRGGSVVNSQGLIRPNGRPTVISLPSGNQTESPLVILDMGQEVGGWVRVHVISETSQAPTLQACFSESTAFMALKPGQNDGEAAYAPGCDTANFKNGYPGFKYSFDSDSHVINVTPTALPGTFTDTQIRGGFRYITLFLSSPGRVAIKAVRVRFSPDPGDADPSAYAGSFKSSNRSLNQLWYAGAYTVEMDTVAPNMLKSNITTQPRGSCWPYVQGEADHADNTLRTANPDRPVIVDGAKRDRDIYTGDLAVSGPTAYLASDDTAAWLNTLSAFAGQQRRNGFVPGNGIICAPNVGRYFSGTYDLWFVNDVYQFWLYTGDRSAVDKLYPVVRGAMRWAATQVGANGLIEFSKESAQGACNTYTYSVCGALSYTNALYYLALQDAAKLATVVHASAEASSYRSAATGIKAVLNQDLYNSKVGAYAFSPSFLNVFPQDAQVMAAYSGIADASQAKRALRYLRENTWETFGSEMYSPTGPPAPVPQGYEPLPTGYEILARYASGTSRIDQLIAQQLMQRYWTYQLSWPFGPQSTFWEKQNQEGIPGIGSFTSLAHGWASMPTVALTTYVLGVRPISGGFAQYIVEPHPGNLAEVSGKVPTRYGPLSVVWKQRADGSFALSLDAPVRTVGRVELPTNNEPVDVRMDGRLMEGGNRESARRADGYIIIRRVTGGRHVFVVHALRAAQQPRLKVFVNPGVSSTIVGRSGVFRVNVYADGAGTISGTLSVTNAAHWILNPESQPFSIRCDGRPAHARLYVYYKHIKIGASAGQTIYFRADSGKMSAGATATLRVARR